MRKLLSLFLLLSSCCYAQQKESKSFAGVKKIVMNTASGNCEILKSIDAITHIELEHHYKNDEFKPIMNQQEGELIIKETFLKNSVSGGNATWKIAVPEGTEIFFKSGSGSFELSNLSLNLDVDIGSGNITIASLSGNVKVYTGSGNLELSNLLGKIMASTGSGDIRINNCKSSIKSSSGSGSIVGRYISITDESFFSSGSGNSKLLLATTPQFDLKVSSGSGDATLDFNGNNIVGEITMKANKNNGSISSDVEFDKTEEFVSGNQVVLKKTVNKGGNIKIHVGTGSGQASLLK